MVSHGLRNPRKTFMKLRQKISGRVWQGFYSRFHGYGTRRDLYAPLVAPKAAIPLSVRPLVHADLDLLFPDDARLSPSERQQIEWRRHFSRKVPRGGFVAVDGRTGRPCFVQWLLSSADNMFLAPYKCFPVLQEDEALVEQSYTVPSHRGLGVMSAATAMISDRAAEFGARHVLAFVGEEGAASLKALRNAGFEPHLRHRRLQIGYGALVFNWFEVLEDHDDVP